MGSLWPIAKHRSFGLGNRVSCAKTDEPILTIYTSYNVFLCREVLLGDSNKAALVMDIIPSPKNPLVWGVNRHFQAKLVKYQLLHIIEITASIPTKLYTVKNTIKYSSWVVQT